MKIKIIKNVCVKGKHQKIGDILDVKDGDYYNLLSVNACVKYEDEEINNPDKPVESTEQKKRRKRK